MVITTAANVTGMISIIWMTRAVATAVSVETPK
jgi:hypothetical protein